MDPAAPRSEPEQRIFFLPGGESMAFRCIPAGSFRMGSRGFNSNEEPIHEVRIEHPFWMAETPVTQAQFAVWTKAEAIDHKNYFHDPPCPENPAENLDWMQANSFCEWLRREVPKGSKNKLPDGFGWFCLPTEAEWEYACRAGTETEYYTGDGDAALMEAGWFGEEWGTGSTHPVRQNSPNAFHLYDMHGNVFEWCHDRYESSAYRTHVDAESAPGEDDRQIEWSEGMESMLQDDRRRVLRGGSWFYSAGGCRSAIRGRRWPDDRRANVGFRVCLVRGPGSEGGATGVEGGVDLAHESFSRGAGPRHGLKEPTDS